MLEWDSVLQEVPKELYEFVLDREMYAGYDTNGRHPSPYLNLVENEWDYCIDEIADMINNTQEHDKELRGQWNRILDQARFA